MTAPPRPRAAARRGPRPPAGLLLLLLAPGCVLIGDDELAFRWVDSGSADGADGADGTDGTDGADGTDGTADCPEEDKVPFYADADGDGFGDPTVVLRDCEQPPAYVANFDDCDDGDASVGPLLTWYVDADGDGYGGEVELLDCDRPSGAVELGGDCDDADLAVNPGALEVCGGGDEDCDGLTDDDDDSVDLSGASTFYADGDGDGFGDPAAPVIACAAPAGAVDAAGDCDDGEALAAPDQDEVCADGIDNNCDGGAPECLLGGSAPLSAAGASFLNATPFVGTGAVVYGGLDLTGDGVADLVLPATGATAGGRAAAGEVSIVPGGAGLLGAQDVAVAAVATLQGAGAGDRLGSLIDRGGDLDGDGAEDLILGAIYADPGGLTDAGALYVVSGPLSGASGVDLAAAAVVTGAVAGGYAGFAAAGAGDADGDGADDLLLGAYRTGDISAGTAYLLLGPLSGEVSASAASLTVTGNRSDRVGIALAGGRDLTGDGLPDLVIAADRADTALLTDAGQVAIEDGALTGALLFDDAAVLLSGLSAYGYAGVGVAPAGDMTGDGVEDLLIAASGEGGGAGAVYLMAGPLTASTDLSAAIARVDGASGDQIGKAMAVAPDLDGDGLDELLIGARGNHRAALFYSPVAGVRGVGAADATFTGASGSSAGSAVGASPDFNGDGVPDLLIGQSGVSAASVVFGGAP